MEKRNSINVKTMNRLLLLIFGLFVGFVSCKKDDKIEINQLVGKWFVYNDDPNLAVDGSKTYTFNDDGTCLITVYSFLAEKA